MTQTQNEYAAQIAQERQQRATMLLGDRSWFTLAGLYWLHEGDNTFGCAESNDLILPGATTPEYAGCFHFAEGQTTVRIAPSVVVTHNDEPITTLTLKHDLSGNPDFITLGTVTMLLIKRGERYAIRIWDTANPERQNFSGLHWFPVDPGYRVTARFVAYDPPKPLTIVTAHGDITPVNSPGYVLFELGGVECALDAEPRGDGLFFNFRDPTNGGTTYGAGRFLYADGAKDGIVTLDFNRATNPYCAYTVYATCPLPPARNRLTLPVEAGEMSYAAH